MASVRLRLTLWYTGMLAVTVASLGAALYFLLTRTMAAAADQDASLTSLAVARAVTLRTVETTGQLELVVPELAVFGDADSFVQVVDTRTGQVVGRSANLGQRQLPPPSESLPTTRQSGGAYDTVDDESGRVRMFTRPILDDTQVIGLVQVGHSLSADDRLLERLRLVLAVIGGLGLPTTALLGWSLAGRALAPIDHMTRTAERIGRARDLSQRLARRGPADELDHLARTINAMLSELEAAHRELGETNARLADANARLERSLSVQRRFVADASHEMRTPLTTIRANADVLRWTMANPGSDEARALEDLACEAERMSRLLEGLLSLARVDAGQPIAFRRTPLRPVVEAALRHAQLLAGGRRVELDVLEEVDVCGNADALRQLMLILVDNALKYTPPGGRLRLRLCGDNGQARVSVCDTGIGVNPQELDHIFDRFYRADAARDTEGSGLGLAIARSIVQQHHGRIEVQSEPARGSTFTVVLSRLEPGAVGS